MTGAAFEKYFCEFLRKQGFWALNIPRAAGGAQPFDVIAMRGDLVIVADCKVISGKSNRFPLDRIEDNQWLAFRSIVTKTHALPMIAVWKSDNIYGLLYHDLYEKRKSGIASVELTDDNSMHRFLEAEYELWLP